MVSANCLHSDSAAYLAGLNDQQRAAVLQAEGPLLVLAGAGTGKTRVVTCRIAHLIASGVPPRQILAVTFTKKAAAEMQQRVDELLGGAAWGLTVCTFHSLGYKLLAENGIRLDDQGKLNLFPPDRQKRLIAQLLEQQSLLDVLDVHAAARFISHIKTSGDCQPVTQLNTPAGRLMAAYQTVMDQQGLVDFDDLLLMPLRMLRESPELRLCYRQRWSHILVDEYQDTNELQYQLIRQLVGPRQNICVVGDDDQSIYGFRGANVQRILDFTREFSGACVVKLEQNYRSKKEILDLANSVIQRAAHRQAKRLLSQCGLGGLVVHHIAPDPEAESDAIATCMLRRNARESINWSDMAVLVRARADSQLIRAALKRRQIPYQSQFDGQDTLDKVTLMTLHRSKGLEFPIVFLPAMEENTLPHYQAIRSGTASVEEERRLLYVGITRARRELILSSCRNRAGRARTVSRFLTELGMR